MKKINSFSSKFFTVSRFLKNVHGNVVSYETFAIFPKSEEVGKFQFSYFCLEVDYMTFPTSKLSAKIDQVDPELSKWDISNKF
jgi:hypothetical protein